MSGFLSLWSAFVATWFVHGTALLVVAALLDRRLGRNEAAREAVFRVALLGGVLAAGVAVARVETGQAAPVTVPEVATEAPKALDFEVLENRVAVIEAGVDRFESIAPVQSAAIEESVQQPEWLTSLTAVRVPDWIGAATLLFAGLGVLRLIGRRIALGRRLAERPNRNDRLQSELESVASGLGLRRTPGLRTTDTARSPLVLGLFRSRVLWPSCAEGRLGSSARRAALAHELAHVRRRDPLWLALALSVEALLPWHPLVRRTRTRMLETAELRADALAARAADATELADGLVEVAAFGVADRRVPACGMSVRQKGLRERVERLLETSAERSVGRLWGSACLAMICCALLAATSLPAFGSQATEDSEVAMSTTAPRQMAVQLKNELSTLERERIAFGRQLRKLRSVMERNPLEDQDAVLLSELSRRLERFDERRVQLAARLASLLDGLTDPTTGEMIR